MTEPRRGIGRRIANYFADVYESVSPRFAVERQKARHQAVMLEKAKQLADRFAESYFAGADTANRLRADRWLTSRLSPDSALEQDMQELRERAGELYRSFGYITGAIDHRTDNVIGIGLTPKAWIKPREGVITEEQANRWSAELDELFEQWEPHAGGTRVSFGSVLRLAHRTWRMSGDAFVAISDMGRADSPIPLQIDVVAPHRIETPPEKAGDPRCRLGIQRDERDQVIGYWVRETHPDDTRDYSQRCQFYPLDRMCQLFEQLFPHQSRGLPWCFAVTTDCRDSADYKEAVIIAAQIAACQAMNISSEYAPDSYQSEIAIRPGAVNIMKPGDTMSAFNPTQPQTTYDMFNTNNLLGISAGLNYPFGWVVRDRRRATFSAGKLEEIDGSVPLKNDFKAVKDLVVRPTWNRLVLEAIIIGESTIPIDLYRQYPHLFQRFKLMPPGRPWTDPQKEVNAAVAAKEHNILTLTEIIQKLTGQDIDDVLETRAYERQREKQLGIVPPIANGNLPPQADESDEVDDEEPADDPQSTRKKVAV